MSVTFTAAELTITCHSCSTCKDNNSNDDR